MEKDKPYTLGKREFTWILPCYLIFFFITVAHTSKNGQVPSAAFIYVRGSLWVTIFGHYCN